MNLSAISADVKGIGFRCMVVTLVGLESQLDQSATSWKHTLCINLIFLIDVLRSLEIATVYMDTCDEIVQRWLHSWMASRQPGQILRGHAPILHN